MRTIWGASLGLAWIIVCGGQSDPSSDSPGNSTTTLAGGLPTTSILTFVQVPATGRDSVAAPPQKPKPPAKQNQKSAEPKSDPAPKTDRDKPDNSSTSDGNSASAPRALSADWAKIVTVDDLTVELKYSANRVEQNLKKQSDFDRFIKEINAEGHLSAILAALIAAHSDAGDWKSVAAEVQSRALELAQAAEAKGAKNFRAAQDAYKKIADLLKKGEKGEKVQSAGSDTGPPDWLALGELAHVMKQVERGYKPIRSGTSNDNAFKKNAGDIRHAAAIVATLSEIAPAFRPNEKDMEPLSAAMAAAARAEFDAAKSLDYEKANKANAALNNACNECHKIKRFVKKGTPDLDF